MEMVILLLVLILASFGYFLMVVVFTKKLIKGSKNLKKKSIKTIKNFRVKQWYNPNTKLVEWIKI